MSYKIEQIQTNNFNLLIPLMQNCFGKSVDIDYFKWKFLENPAGIVLGFVALAEDGQAAAYYGVIPEKYSIDGMERIIYQSCDTMTHSAHRRKGLFKLLANHTYDYLRKADALFIIGFGGATSTPGFIKFGWHHLFDIEYFFIPAQLKWLYGGKAKHVRKGTIEDLLKLQPTPNTKVHQVKDEPFLNWRLKNPEKDYQIITDETGYAVYYLWDDKLMLLDLWSKEIESLKNLRKYLLQLVTKHRLRGIVTYAQPSSTYGQQLKAVKFLQNPFGKGPMSEKIPFIVYADEDTLNQYQQADCWCVTPFDHDSY